MQYILQNIVQTLVLGWRQLWLFEFLKDWYQSPEYLTETKKVQVIERSSQDFFIRKVYSERLNTRIYNTGTIPYPDQLVSGFQMIKAIWNPDRILNGSANLEMVLAGRTF
jgi:hypothetical protein